MTEHKNLAEWQAAIIKKSMTPERIDEMMKTFPWGNRKKPERK